LEAEEAESFSHAEMTTLELADFEFPKNLKFNFFFLEKWTRRFQVGWKILCHILHHGEKQRTPWEFRKASSAAPSSLASEYFANSGDFDITMSSGNGYKISCDDCL
jgi:hypothetical protein